MPQKSSISVAVPYPVEKLRRVARRMAQKSVNRLSELRIVVHLRRLNHLLRAERRCKLDLGDVLVTLVDRHALRPVDLARATKERANHLSEMLYVSRMFPQRVREPHVPYTIYWTAMRTVRKFKALNLDPMETLREIAAHGFTQHRQVTAHFAATLRKLESDETLRAMSSQPTAGWVDRCHHIDCRELVNLIPARSAKIVHADPPYANYRRVADGRYSAGSVTSTRCDNETAAEAIRLTVDLLRDWGPKLVRGGTLLLWQAAGPIRKQIAHAIEQYEWEVETVVVWDKGTIQPGNFETPYSPQSEWLWVLRRAGDSLTNHDGSRRGDIIRFTPVHRLEEAHNRTHGFEKPLELCRFLVGKHSYAGEVVVDLCACTGSMALAAAEMGRRWVYVESNDINFKLGAERMNGMSTTKLKIAG